MWAAILAGVLGLSALPVGVAQVRAADLGTVTVTGTGSLVFTPSTVVGAVGDTITIKVEIQGAFLTPVIAGSTGRLLIGDTTCDSTQGTCLASPYDQPLKTYTVGTLGEVKFVENGGSGRVGTLTIAAPAPSTTSSTTTTTTVPPPTSSTTSTTSPPSTTSTTTTTADTSDDESEDETVGSSAMSTCYVRAMVVAPSKKRRSACISITGERGQVAGKSGIIVNGRTRGLKQGSTVKAWVKFPGQTTYSEGTIKAKVAGSKFTWSRKTGKKTYVYFTTENEQTKSNVIIIPAK